MRRQKITWISLKVLNKFYIITQWKFFLFKFETLLSVINFILLLIITLKNIFNNK